MKLICMKENKEVKWIVENDAVVELLESSIEMYGSFRMTVSDCNASNTEVIETDVAPPEDWLGSKYIIEKSNDSSVADSWVFNSEYIEQSNEESA